MDTITVNAPVSRRVGGLLAACVAVSLVALSAGLVWLVAPELSPFAGTPTPLQTLTGTGASADGARLAATLLAVAGAIGTAAGLAHLAPRRRIAWLVPTAALTALAAAILLVGFGGIAVAGYSMAFLVPLGIVVAIVSTVVRRPMVGVPIAVVAVVAAVLVQLSDVPVLDFVGLYIGKVGADPVPVLATLGIIALAGLWMVAAAGPLVRGESRFGDAVVRWRVPITIVAAACSLPYAVARASWLTPWPLFGGSQEAFDAEPTMRVIGLMLGLAMLTGGVLTLGLVLPWGSTMPRWLPGGGRPVPVALAVVPASIVAALFTAGAIDLVAIVVDPPQGIVFGIEALVLFPFWLWGPLLGLATWAYARRRLRG